MREIKFRAWDKNEQQMRFVSDGFDKFTESIGALLDWFEDEDLMQYTGLKDKNGVEIYEGDIVRSISQEDGENTLVVKHFAYQGTFASGFALFDNSGDDEYYHDSVEIIGNIYENPDLIS